VNVAFFRTKSMLVSRSRHGARSWGAPELDRSAAQPFSAYASPLIIFTTFLLTTMLY
jgi:hypothetical protein